jgi:hypothetical protein
MSEGNMPDKIKRSTAYREDQINMRMCYLEYNNKNKGSRNKVKIKKGDQEKFKPQRNSLSQKAEKD